MIEIPERTHQAFEQIRAGRVTDSGRACVDLAEEIFTSGKSSEARQWVNLGLKADAASTPEELRKIKDWIEKRERGKKGIGDMRKPNLAVVGRGEA